MDVAQVDGDCEIVEELQAQNRTNTKAAKVSKSRKRNKSDKDTSKKVKSNWVAAKKSKKDSLEKVNRDTARKKDTSKQLEPKKVKKTVLADKRDAIRKGGKMGTIAGEKVIEKPKVVKPATTQDHARKVWKGTPDAPIKQLPKKGFLYKEIGGGCKHAHKSGKRKSSRKKSLKKKGLFIQLVIIQFAVQFGQRVEEK
ncbi:hypothetical protein FRB99_004783, partial [Tulasnella sp. 403]